MHGQAVLPVALAFFLGPTLSVVPSHHPDEAASSQEQDAGKEA